MLKHIILSAFFGASTVAWCAQATPLLKFTDQRLETLQLQKSSLVSPLHQLLFTGLTFVQLITPAGVFTIYQVQDLDTPAYYVRPTHAHLPQEYVEAVEQELLESNLLVAELCRSTIPLTVAR